MTIQAIVFDLGGVIVEFDYTKFFNEVIVPSPLFKPNSFIFLEFWRQSDTYHQGLLTPEEFYHQTCELLQSCEVAQARFFDAFNSVISHPREDVVRIIEKIRDQDKFTLIMLSNINASHWKYMRKQKWTFILLFDEFVLSHKVKLTKPDPKIFQLVIKEAGCMPEEILFIEDGLNNLRAAEEMGINGIHFTSAEQLIEDLKKNGIDL